jgi:hypothetical protein
VMVGWGEYGRNDAEKPEYRYSEDFDEAWKEYDEFKDGIRLSINCHAHGGIDYYVEHTPSSNKDGWIYCTRETIKREWGSGPNAEGKTPDEQAVAFMTAEVEEYNLYQSGRVYGWCVEKFIPACDHGHGAEWVEDDTDTSGAWGYFGEWPTYGGCVEEACSEAGIPVPDELKKQKPVAA